MQMCEKVGKVAKHSVFSMFCGSGGSKGQLAKAAGVEPAGQMRNEKLHAVVARSTVRRQNVQSTPFSEHFWKLRCQKKCTPLWREAHFEVKMYKAQHSRTTFGSCDVEKVHAVVARSHISKSKCAKHTIVGPLLEVEMSKKCTPLWREANFEVKMYKTLHVRATFGGSDVVLRGRRKGLCTLSKVSKTWGFRRMPKNDGRRGALEEDLQRCMSRGRCSTKDMFIRDVFGGQGAHFLRGVAFWSIRSSGLLRWFCLTGAALRMTWHQFFVAGAVLYTGGVEKSQNALARGSQRCTQLSIFEGSLAELLCFWRC